MRTPNTDCSLPRKAEEAYPLPARDADRFCEESRGCAAAADRQPMSPATETSYGSDPSRRGSADAAVRCFISLGSAVIAPVVVVVVVMLPREEA
jgi:hypothetical protein